VSHSGFKPGSLTSKGICLHYVMLMLLLLAPYENVFDILKPIHYYDVIMDYFLQLGHFRCALFAMMVLNCFKYDRKIQLSPTCSARLLYELHKIIMTTLKIKLGHGFWFCNLALKNDMTIWI